LHATINVEMVFFGKNIENDSSLSRSSILSFFNDRKPEELARLATELSGDAKNFFELSLQALLGQMPDSFAEVHITTSKQSLNQLLLSAMVTGYLTKIVEDKISLEKLYNYSPDEMNKLIDQLIKPERRAEDDIDQIL
jgi:hypothetical protein